MLWNPRQSIYNGKKGKQEILVSKQWFFIMLFHNVNNNTVFNNNTVLLCKLPGFPNPLPGSASDLEEQG